MSERERERRRLAGLKDMSGKQTGEVKERIQERERERAKE